jgi:hypothetical protein
LLKGETKKELTKLKRLEAMSLTKILRNEIRKKGITVSILAQKTGIPSPTVYDWLEGKQVVLRRVRR